MADSKGLGDKTVGLFYLLKDQAFKIMPYVYAAGSGEFDFNLFKIQAGPLLKASLNAKLETPLPQMFIEAVMRRYRSKKTEKAVRLRNQEKENKDDDWIVVSSQLEFKTECSNFLELTSKLEEVLEEEEREFGGYIHKHQIIEHYLNLLDEKEDAAGETEDLDQDSERDDLELPAISTEEEVPDLNQQEGGISAPEKNRIKKQKKMDNYAEERSNLLKDLEERKAELKRQYYEDVVKLEKEFSEELARLVEKYSCIG